MKIVVNGKTVDIDVPQPYVPTLTYGDVVELAGYERTRVLSVVYHARLEGDASRQGSLSPGKVVNPTEGMIFNVADTSNA